MKIKQRLLKFIMISAIPLFCISCAVFGVALALKSVNVEMDGMFNYKPVSALIFTPIAETTNCTVEAANTDITTANIPETVSIDGTVYTVTTIDYFAFSGCTDLTNITIPSSVTNIESIAFGNCTGLTSITIPASVTSINYSAFRNCTSLTSITIPASVTSLEKSVFDGCTGLTSINVESGNTIYHSAGNCIIETASKTLIQGCKTSAIPRDGSVTRIEELAFSGCSSLTSITIPESVISIGIRAFDGCSNLESVTFARTSDWSAGGTSVNVSSSSTNATYLTSTYVATDWSWSAADSYTQLSFNYNDADRTASVKCSSTSISGEVVIPKQVTYNGYLYTVTSIANGGFNDCQSITSVTIPSSISRIENHAFHMCYALSTFNTFWKNEALSMATSSITYIGESAFAGTQFTELFIPSSVTYIGNNCFGTPNGNISGISSVTFADRNNWYLENNGSYTAITISSTGSENATKFKAGGDWEGGNLCKLSSAEDYSSLTDLTFTPISGTTNCSVWKKNGDVTTVKIPE